MNAGVVAGYPGGGRQGHAVRRLLHEVDSSEMAFKIAGSMAFKEAMRKADPTLLEPIMKVVRHVPRTTTWATSSATSTPAAARYPARSWNGGLSRSTPFVPLSEMFGYATDLRSRTQGRGQYSMEPSHYIELPKGLQSRLS
jgi:elongation factor G